MVGGTVANVALCAALVPPFGQSGACWASLMTAVLLVAVGVVRSERVWRIDFPVRAVCSTAVVSAAVCAILLGLTTTDRVALGVRLSATAALLAASVAAFLALLIGTARGLRASP